MFFIIIYLSIGIYSLLMSFRIIHKKYMQTWNRSRIIALRITAIGFLILGFYYSWFYYFLSTEEGKAILELQKKLNLNYMNQVK